MNKEIEWIDVTTIGSMYETQLNPHTNSPTGKYRHRRLHVGHDGGEMTGEWQRGLPPDWPKG